MEISAKRPPPRTKTLLTKLANAGDPGWRFFHAYAARLAAQQKRNADAQRSADAALQLSRQQAIDPAASIFVGEDLNAACESDSGMGDTPAARQDARAAVVHLTAVAGTGHPSYRRAQALSSLAPSVELAGR